MVNNNEGASTKVWESSKDSPNRARSESPGGTRRRIVVRAVRSPSPAPISRLENDKQVKNSFKYSPQYVVPKLSFSAVLFLRYERNE